VKKAPGAVKSASVELLANTEWTVWPGRDEWMGGGKEWVEKSVYIAEIAYSDSASKVMPIYTLDGAAGVTNAMVAEKWAAIISHSKSYAWAEQPGFAGAFVNWPGSLYKAFQTNSNTFVRTAVAAATLTMVEMSGNHPGNAIPSQNTDDAWTGGPLYFYAAHTPWTSPAKPKPAGSPP